MMSNYRSSTITTKPLGIANGTCTICVIAYCIISCGAGILFADYAIRIGGNMPKRQAAPRAELLIQQGLTDNLNKPQVSLYYA